ncbi:hypothetical protein ACLSZ3_04505 [Avibacterium gallinarum]|uniref:hypothetical protein n=1 Tax=Avibacterium gallinarum TaxID=755 RepID=UPI003BF7F063
MKKLVLIGLVSAVLAGCGSYPVVLQKATPVPSDRIMAYETPHPGYAKVTIIRDGGIQASACYLGVMYRQTLLARFGTGEKADFYLPEGEDNFSVIVDPYGKFLCSGSFNPAVEKQTIKKDKENIFRISLGPWRRPRLLPM